MGVLKSYLTILGSVCTTNTMGSPSRSLPLNSMTAIDEAFHGAYVAPVSAVTAAKGLFTVMYVPSGKEKKECQFKRLTITDDDHMSLIAYSMLT